LENHKPRPHKPHYRNKEAQDNQEVVTPPELVEKIYGYLSEDELKGDILDPCVGPGALVEPLLANPIFKTLTMLDIQECHIEALKEKFPAYKEFNQDPEWEKW